MKETHSVVYPFFCECVCVCGMETTPSSLQSIWRCLYFIFLVFIRSRWNPFDITWQMGNTWSLMCFVCFFPSWLDSSRPIYSFSSSFSFPPSFANVKWGLPLSLMSFWALYKSAIIWETGKRGQRRWEESTTCKRGKAFWCYCPTRLQRSRICLSKIKKKKKSFGGHIKSSWCGTFKDILLCCFSLRLLENRTVYVQFDIFSCRLARKKMKRDIL